MISNIMWTWDVVRPEPEPEPEPDQSQPAESLHSARSISRLFAAIFDSFRDEPATYHRLAAIVKAWREQLAPSPPLPQCS